MQEANDCLKHEDPLYLKIFSRVGWKSSKFYALENSILNNIIQETCFQLTNGIQ